MEFHTEYLALNALLLVAGLLLLIKGSDLFIDAAAAIARRWHVSELTIGLTLVSIGTALPEFAASFYASICHQNDFVVGNVVGSISANILLVLGLGALIGEGFNFPRKLLTRDVLFMTGVFALTAVLMFAVGLGKGGGPGLNRFGGIGLMVLAFFYCRSLFKHPQNVEGAGAGGKTAMQKGFPLTEILLLIAGFVMVTGGSKLSVDNVVWGAEMLHVSPLVISATVVGFGTALPELAVTVSGVLKKKHDLAIGNIIGSCTFNVLLIFGSCSAFHPLAVEGRNGAAAIGFMCFAALLLTALMALNGKRLTRLHGALLFVCYLGFLGYQFRSFWQK